MVITPINYELYFEPDFNTFQFYGKTTILLEITDSVKEIVLNSNQLAFWNCQVKINEEFKDCSFTVDNIEETVTVQLPESMKNEIALKFEYSGKLPETMTGFYRSKYSKPNQNDKEPSYILTTQFQTKSARNAFPCFDEPGKKATFDVEFTIDDHLTGISNMPIEKEESLGNGKKTIKFQRTIKMSTYLLYFGIGEWEYIENKKTPNVRVFTTPGKTKYAKESLEFGKKVLEYGEKTFGVKYPIEKLDLIAVPDFAAGAMENYGAITFRENLLLNYPDITSELNMAQSFAVISHEIVHLWFGDLVSPEKWIYVWLNEGFATYFGFKFTNHIKPEWNVMNGFIQRSVMGWERDSFSDTTAIELPNEEQADISATSAPLVYSKAASIIRMIENYLGEDHFQKGMQKYLEKYSYNVSKSENFWQTIDEISTDISVSEMMESWVKQPGYPFLTVKRTDNLLTLKQRRFTLLDHQSAQKWIIPVSVWFQDGNGNSTTKKYLMKDQIMEIPIESEFLIYKINVDHTGFYRVKYEDSDILKQLGDLISKKLLSTIDRWGLQYDLFAFFRKGEVSFSDYLEFLSFYKNENDPLVLQDINNNLYRLFHIIKDERRIKVQDFAVNLFSRVLDTIGYKPQNDEIISISQLRESIIWTTTIYENSATHAFVTQEYKKLLANELVHPAIRGAVLKSGAFIFGQEAFDWMNDQLENINSEQELIHIANALGGFKEEQMAMKSIELAMRKIPLRNRFNSLFQISDNPYLAPYIWMWFKKSNPMLIKMIPPMILPMAMERLISMLVPNSGLNFEKEVKEFLLTLKLPIKPIEQKKINTAIEMALERLEINMRIRENRFQSY
ncbi:MAG: M1 family metallopeptidase [Candidatus Hodarchaeales archaeon]|jgi:tricorn protease interacting factor F2/3